MRKRSERREFEQSLHGFVIGARGAAWQKWPRMILDSPSAIGSKDLQWRALGEACSQYFELHPVNPQLRLIRRAAEIVREGGVIAYPTDSCYALGCHIGDKNALERSAASARPTAIITSRWCART